MSGTRLQKKSTPQVRRTASWSATNYYHQGSFLYNKTIDSDHLDVYVCLEDHYANDSDKRLFLSNHDSEYDSDLILNTSLWLHFISSRELDSEVFSFVTLQRKIQEVPNLLKIAKADFDSEILVSYQVINNLPDSDSVDSDLKIIQPIIATLKNKGIALFDQADISDSQLVGWDGTNNKYVGISAIRTVNAFGPDANGDVPVTLIKILSGTKDERPDSERNGSIFTIEGDSDVFSNGLSYIYKDSEWFAIESAGAKVIDLKFLKRDGSNTLTGPLYVVNSNTANSIVNKAYSDLVLTTNGGQPNFYYADSELAINTSILDSDDFAVTTDQKPGFYHWDGLNLSQIGSTNVGDYPFLLPDVVVETDQITLTVKCANLNQIVEGVLTVKRDGVLEAFSLGAGSNASGVFNTPGEASQFVLLDQTSQEFKITLINTFDNSKEYEIKHISDTGDEAWVTKLAGATVWSAQKSLDSTDYGFY